MKVLLISNVIFGHELLKHIIDSGFDVSGIISGKEHGVNDMGALEVITEDGIKTFSSGEVSMRKAE